MAFKTRIEDVVGRKDLVLANDRIYSVDGAGLFILNM